MGQGLNFQMIEYDKGPKGVLCLCKGQKVDGSDCSLYNVSLTKKRRVPLFIDSINH